MKNKRKRMVTPRASGGWAEADFSDVSRRARGLFQGSFWLAGGIVLAGLGVLLMSDPPLAFPFIAIFLPALVGIRLWAWAPTQGLPLLPIFIAQQALIYGLPVAIKHREVELASPGTLMASCGSVGVFLVCVVAGWRGGWLSTASRPSRGNIAFGTEKGRSLSLAFILLGVALLFYLGTRTGLLFKLLPGPLEGLFPVIRTFATAASMLGAMLGGLVIGGRPDHPRSWSYWTLLAGIGILSVADVLLSGASGLVLSAAVGLALGRRGMPWRFLLVTFAMVGFLNQGKFVMRERYWGTREGEEATAVGLLELPGFFAEWSAASGEMLFEGGAKNEVITPDDEEGQSILNRINNIQNMTYVVEALERRGFEPLWGETYAVIPPLLVPRVFWPNKPRAHEGQILLNLHFGRQMSVEQTEKTYIAWGLLPEAIGNFGVWPGAVIGGLFYGFLMGLFEQLSRRKRLFSIEGTLLATLMLSIAGSYEMVASVFVTSTFQALVAVAIAGWLLRSWFQPAPTPPRRGGKKRPTLTLGRSRGATGSENESLTNLAP